MSGARASAIPHLLAHLDELEQDLVERRRARHRRAGRARRRWSAATSTVLRLVLHPRSATVARP